MIGHQTFAPGNLKAGWSDERVERLKALWADGVSASQIAGELGGVTRNAVIGKVHRLGLSGLAKSPSSSSAPRPRKARAAAQPAAPRRKLGRVCSNAWVWCNPVSAPAAPEPAPELNAGKLYALFPPEKRRTLLELGAHTCRWPVGEPGSGDFFFCGADTFEDLPYCLRCSGWAYNAAARSPRVTQIMKAAQRSATLQARAAGAGG